MQFSSKSRQREIRRVVGIEVILEHGSNRLIDLGQGTNPVLWKRDRSKCWRIIIISAIALVFHQRYSGVDGMYKPQPTLGPSEIHIWKRHAEHVIIPTGLHGIFKSFFIVFVLKICPDDDNNNVVNSENDTFSSKRFCDHSQSPRNDPSEACAFLKAQASASFIDLMLIRTLSSTLFLALIILFIPLTFDIGGRDAGLAYSLALSSFYFVLSLLRIATPQTSRFRATLINLARAGQWLVIPGLAIWALGKFSIDGETGATWVERTFYLRKELHNDNTPLWTWLFGPGGVAETIVIGSWDKILRWSSPVFQLLEGFCSLLVIQATGQLTRWLVNRSDRSDAWMLTLIVSAAATTSSSVYFLWRVLQFPDVDHLDSTLIGIAIASAIFLCSYGVVSGRGTAVESSLLFAYIVLCIYQIFTDYKPSDPGSLDAQPTPEFPPFPPIIMSSYSAIIHALSALPGGIADTLQFTAAAFKAVTPSVLVSLGYRLFVFYASTRIIPAINESGARGLSMEPSLEDSNVGTQFLAFLSWFSPSILIAVYTSLLMQHFATTMGGYTPGLTETISSWWSGNGQPGMDGNLWKWINLVGTMGLYAVELWLGDEDNIGSQHWKVD